MSKIELEIDGVSLTHEEVAQVLQGTGECEDGQSVASIEELVAGVVGGGAEGSVSANVGTCTTWTASRIEARYLPITVDIETIPDYSREHLFGFDPLPAEIPEEPAEHLLEPEVFVSAGVDTAKESLLGRNPPQAWIDACTIHERLGKKRKGMLELLSSMSAAKVGSGQELRRRQKIMSTTPEMLSIVCIGLAVGDEPPRTFLSHASTGLSERDILQSFWTSVSKNPGPLIGYNILNFDLPSILVRSCLLGVRPTRKFDLSPWKQDVIDLMARRFGRGTAMKLKDLSRLYGLDNAAEGVDGSQVLDLWLHDPQKLCEYCASDISQTRELFRVWEGAFC